MSAPWFAEKGVVAVDAERRVPVCNSHGRPDAALAGELVAIHNEQLQQLRDDIHAAALENEQLRQERDQACETRNAAQSEATRQTNDRRDFTAAIRKACRVGAGGDCLSVIYRLQRLGDAARAVLQVEPRQ